MKSYSLEYVLERIQNAHPRTRKAHFNTFLGLLVRGGGMLISLLLVPLTLDYLSKEIYGTWLTISSVVTMLTFMDIGIGNGLRNKLSEAVTKGDTVLARAYISTSYFVFGLIQITLLILFFIVSPLVPWQRIFNTAVDLQQLRLVILITVTAMTVKMVLDILSYVLMALQESGQVGLINLFSNVLILIGTYLLTQFTKGNLIYLASIAALTPMVVSLITGVILYADRLSAYKPTLKLVNLRYTKNLLSLGYKFFFIQLTGIVLFYTDNLIITQLFGPTEVTTYNVVFRYFNAINLLFTIAVAPYWSAFTEASVKGDMEWIKQTYNRLQKVWLGLVMAVILMTLASNAMYHMWLGERVEIPFRLNICMGIFCIISSWNNIIAAVVNGLGKIKLQLFYASSAALVNIPLTILLGKKMEMGSAGVILATAIALLICSVFGSIQVQRLTTGKAEGIWNQ